MTMDFRVASSTTTSSGAGLSGTIPVGTLDGDLLIAFATSGASGGSVTNPPAGWTLVPDSLISGADLTSIAYYRFFATGVSGPSFTWNTAASAKTVDVVAYSHELVATNPWVIQAQSTNSASSGSINMTVTPHADNCWLVGFVAANNGLSITWSHQENIPYVSQTEWTEISADEPVKPRIQQQTDALNRQVFDEALLGGQDAAISRTVVPSLSDAQVGILIAVKLDDPVNVVTHINNASSGISCKKQIIGNIPQDTVVGDLMLAFVWAGDSFNPDAGGGSTSIFPPVGWNELIAPTLGPHSTGTQKCAVYWKHYSNVYDEDPVWSFSVILASATVDIISYRGSHQSVPINASTSGRGTAGTKTLSVTPSEDDNLLVAWALVDNASDADWTLPTSMAERRDTIFNTGNRVIADDLMNGQSGQAQSRSITSSVSSDIFMVLVSVEGRDPDPIPPIFIQNEMPRLLVEMQIGDIDGTGTGSTQLILDDPDHSLVGTATLSGGTGGGVFGFGGVFTDVTDYVVSVEISRGSQRVTGSYTEYDAGTCTVVLGDLDRRFDPTNQDGPYTVNGQTQLLPMAKVRVRAQWPTGSTIYTLFEGFADSWNVEWNPPHWAEVSVACTDAFKVFESNQLKEIEEEAQLPEGIDDLTHERVHRLLNKMNWPQNKRKIMTSNVYLSGTKYGATGLEELKKTALTEVGHVFMSTAGDLVFFARDTPFTRSMSVNSQLTIGDDETVDVATYRSIEMQYDDAALINQVTVTPPKAPTTLYPALTDDAGQTEQNSDPIPEPVMETVEDPASINKFLLHTADFSDIFLPYNDQAAAVGWGQWYVFWAKDPEQRIETITINPRSQPYVLFPQVLMREIMDKVTVIRRPFGIGDPIQRDLHIIGIKYSIKPMEWEVGWQFREAKFGDTYSGYGINLFRVDEDNLDSEARIPY